MAEQVYFEDINEGDEITKLTKNCSSQQLVMWAAGSGDFYQIHYDKDFAQSTGLKVRMPVPRYGLPQPGHRLSGSRHRQASGGRREPGGAGDLDREPGRTEDIAGDGGSGAALA
jgi:hypothetical protein